MPGKTIHSAILLLIIGNAMAIGSDVFIKLLASDTAVLQFAFLRILITVALLLPFVLRLPAGSLFQGFGIHAVRAHIHLGGIVCMVIGLIHLPLATANAVFYAAPVMVLVLAWLVHREPLSWLTCTAVFGGFLGILLILRPVEISWAAIAALGAALALAINAIMVRSLPSGQHTSQKLFLNYLLILPASGLLALWEGAPLDPEVLVNAAGSAVLIMGYNTTVLLAYRSVAANQITSAEYTGLIWAVIVGWLFFGEVPGVWFFVGSALIVVPLVLIGLKSRKRRTAETVNPGRVTVHE